MASLERTHIPMVLLCGCCLIISSMIQQSWYRAPPEIARVAGEFRMQVIHGLASRPIMIVSRFLIWEGNIESTQYSHLSKARSKAAKRLHACVITVTRDRQILRLTYCTNLPPTGETNSKNQNNLKP
jgi:hypothetical protein